MTCMIDLKTATQEIIVARHTKKLKCWHDLLHKIMPDYFFQTLSSSKIEDVLPLLFNIDSQAGIQKIARGNTVILIYLKSDECNLLTTSKLMMEYDITATEIHESREQIVINNIPRTLVIEQYTVESIDFIPSAPLFSRKEVAAAYRQITGKSDPRLTEVYNRINWEAVADLTLDRLADRLRYVLNVQAQDSPAIAIEKFSRHELRLTFARSLSQSKGVYYRIINTLNAYGFHINRAYDRHITHQGDVTSFDHLPVTITTLYLDSRGVDIEGRKIKELLWQLGHIAWCRMEDLLHRELVDRHHWTVADTNVMRAASTFVHSQLAYVNRNIYHHPDIWRYMALYEPILRDLLALFKGNHDPLGVVNERKSTALTGRISHAIRSINTGISEKDSQIKTVFYSLLNFFVCIQKTNFFVADKTCLSFRLDPLFMTFYEKVAPEYSAAFPADRPVGVFFFYRENCISFHIRFADIARGGWRTVIPQAAENLLERDDAFEFARDELFREVYVLAHTQHMKNKDIYEGGAKMISLLYLDGMETQKALYQAQRSVCSAFLQLIASDGSGKLHEENVLDRLGRNELIEIGPDENLHDVMINWMGNYAERAAYALGSGFISGKHGRGINHKEYGVTSFGVHEYVLKVLDELGINLKTDPFSVKISGGPAGDVAGNLMKLLLQKNPNSIWLYPELKIVAITDGPAAVYDNAGIDRDELLRLVELQKALDNFSPETLRGDKSFIVYSGPLLEGGVEKYRYICKFHGQLQEKLIGRDDFMRIFQDNINHKADIFIPCGGRPSTIDATNWEKYLIDGRPSSLAIVEGANSFITPAARDRLQESGVLIVKDASANKCGVITSSYEILSGLMLSDAEFKANKAELLAGIMLKLKQSAQKEADWLFTQHKRDPGSKLTDLTEKLSRRINGKHAEIMAYLSEHPELVQNEIILDHLPRLFRDKFPDRLDRIPAEYLKAIVAVELASRIIYRQSESTAEEIKAVFLL